ncbi:MULTISPECIES: hypothetical protein [Arthrobacter]|nr:MULTISPECIES: hypothetical protein [Arthrobacter]
MTRTEPSTATYGLDPETTPALLAKLRNLPADLRDQILTSKGTTK